jgi:alanine dehydrogenase
MTAPALPFIDGAAVARALDDATLVERLRRAFRTGGTAPPRHHHAIPAGGAGGTLLLMPAWRAGRDMGVKVATVFADNPARGLPTVMATYMLLDGASGAPRAIIEGVELTRRRTAAASALAASYLARREARKLLMVGAGAMAPHLIRAHGAVRPINEVTIWNRSHDKAVALARRVSATTPAKAVRDLEAAVAGADIISCATMAREPLIQGRWLKGGQHLDLVGGFTPEMREVDDLAVQRARLYVDSRDSAPMEAGDIADPLARGVITAADIQADLFELCRGDKNGRGNDDDITLFKSVGHGLEDLVAAELALEHAAP